MTPKVKHNHLSTHRSVILHYYNLGHRCAAGIARQTKIPVRTIRYNLAKIRKEGSVEHRRGIGRPRKITVKDSIAIGPWIRRNNEITAEEIVEKLQLTKNLNVSRWTVRRELHRIKGQISCHSFRTIMDGPLYVEILRKHLLGGAKKQSGSRWRYQQDNDPKHTSRVAKQFLENQVPETIDWPSNSPDINPIENMWSILKRRVEKRKPSNIDELDQFLHEEWKKS
ncbi:unnamed protein product [Rotaria sp. Silwood1]|nr:unnamed protein product [Rotaria sp. Silwood1]